MTGVLPTIGGSFKYSKVLKIANLKFTETYTNSFRYVLRTGKKVIDSAYFI